MLYRKLPWPFKRLLKRYIRYGKHPYSGINPV